MVRKSTFVLALGLIVIVTTGCGSSSSTPNVSTSADGHNGTITNSDGSKTQFSTSPDGSNVAVKESDGKTSTMSTDAKGTTKIKSEGGTGETGGEITEADLGVPIYPGATQIPHKGSKFEVGGKKSVMGQFETADAPDKVIDFYAGKIKVSGSPMKSATLNMVAGTLPSGAHVTVSAKTENGKTHINLGMSQDTKK